jgi:hypothetical protein
MEESAALLMRFYQKEQRDRQRETLRIAQNSQHSAIYKRPPIKHFR